VNKINEKSREWIEEDREIQDARVLWDFLKYKICYETIVYRKRKYRTEIGAGQFRKKT